MWRSNRNALTCIILNSRLLPAGPNVNLTLCTQDTVTTAHGLWTPCTNVDYTMVSMLITNWDIWAPPGLTTDSITKWKCENVQSKDIRAIFNETKWSFFRILWWTLDGKIFETIKRLLYNYHYILIVGYSIRVRFYNKGSLSIKRT